MLIQLPKTVQGFKPDAKTTVRRWLKKVGEAVGAGQPIVELETEDAIFHLQAPADGTVGEIQVEAGKTVSQGTALGMFNPGAAAGGKLQKEQSTPQASAVELPASSAPASGMPILMPQAGNTMEEGTILKWKVKVGDTVAVGQILCDIETDKATVEFESTDAGKISWLAAEGSVVAVKQAIAMIGGSPSETRPLGSAAPAPGNHAVSANQTSTALPHGRVSDGTSDGTPILMPQAGNTMEEGTILKWKVKVGDTVAVGQVLCDVETDKATVEFESTDAGKISWLAAEGSVVAVKQPIATIGGTPGNSVAARGLLVPAETISHAQSNNRPASAQPATLIAQAASAPAARSNGGRVKASPAARKFAAQRGVDLATLPAGSGPGGRILSTDVMIAKTSGKPAAAAPSVAPAPIGPGGRRPMSKMRKAIATNLQTSKQTVPHFYVRLTINADPLFTFYKAQKPATGCTLNDVILLAVGRLVGEFPAFRTRVDGNDLVETPAANIGVAVSVNDGLVVPVVMNIHSMSLAQLAPEARRVVESARNGKIENMGKGVFTISNMGMLGVEEFAAIINPPESGILAIAGVRESVIVKDGAMRAGRVMTLTLSVDHRVVDGALAAGYMARLKELLEAPEKLL